MKYKSIAHLFLFLVILTSCTSEKKKTVSPKNNIDNLIKDWLTKTSIPSVSIVLIQNGKITKAKAYGYTNLKTKTKALETSIYNTGSNFKSVTATAIMQLAEKGMIDIDSSVNKYLKQPISYFDESFPITPRHLMSHQSGIPSSFYSNKIWEHKPERTLRDISLATKPNLEPEKQYQYSNDGYSVLGLIIEDITGLSYEEYIWKNILKPIGIETYGFLRPSAEMIENLALPYHIRYNKTYPTDQLHLEQYPAGDVFLKPIDMGKFLMMHLNNGQMSGKTILSSESIQKMHQSHIKDGENFHYGLGFEIVMRNGKTYSSHQGSAPGYLSALALDFETKSGVYIATNVSASSLQEKQVQPLLSYLFKHVKNDSLPATLDFPTDDQFVSKMPSNIDLSKYIGKYNIVNAPVSFTIEKIGKRIFLINPSKKRFMMDYLDENKFFLTTENEDIEFKAVNDSIKSLTLYSGPNQIEAIKE